MAKDGMSLEEVDQLHKSIKKAKANVDQDTRMEEAVKGKQSDPVQGNSAKKDVEIEITNEKSQTVKDVVISYQDRSLGFNGQQYNDANCNILT